MSDAAIPDQAGGCAGEAAEGSARGSGWNGSRGKASSPVFLAGRRKWTENYGHYVSERNWWRVAALGALAVAGLTGWNNIGLRSKAHPVVYTVRENALGDPVAVSRADEPHPADARDIRDVLRRVIEDVRAVSTDADSEGHMIREAFRYVDRNGRAYAVLRDWLQRGASTSPFTRAASASVGVEVISVLSNGGETWRVGWRETTTPRDGGAQSVETWEAAIRVRVVPPETEQQVNANPWGVFIEDLDWNRTREGGA